MPTMPGKTVDDMRWFPNGYRGPKAENKVSDEMALKLGHDRFHEVYGGLMETWGLDG